MRVLPQTLREETHHRPVFASFRGCRLDATREILKVSTPKLECWLLQFSSITRRKERKSYQAPKCWLLRPMDRPRSIVLARRYLQHQNRLPVGSPRVAQRAQVSSRAMRLIFDASGLNKSSTVAPLGCRSRASRERYLARINRWLQPVRLRAPAPCRQRRRLEPCRSYPYCSCRSISSRDGGLRCLLRSGQDCVPEKMANPTLATLASPSRVARRAASTQHDVTATMQPKLGLHDATCRLHEAVAGFRGEVASASVSEVDELEGDLQVGFFECGDHLLEVVALFALHTQFLAPRG